MTGRTLVCKKFGAPLDRATARRQSRAIFAAHVDIPPGDLFGRGLLAVTKMPGLLVVPKMPRLLVVPKMPRLLVVAKTAGLRDAGKGACGADDEGAQQQTNPMRAKQRRRSRPV